MVPLNSWPATSPGLSPQPSSSMWMSEPQMPQWSTSTSTSPSDGRGTGRSSTTTSPGRRYTAAGMTSGSSVIDVTSPVRPVRIVRSLTHV